jgi:hypothetical protein
MSLGASFRRASIIILLLSALVLPVIATSDAGALHNGCFFVAVPPQGGVCQASSGGDQFQVVVAGLDTIFTVYMGPWWAHDLYICGVGGGQGPVYQTFTCTVPLGWWITGKATTGAMVIRSRTLDI